MKKLLIVLAVLFVGMALPVEVQANTFEHTKLEFKPSLLGSNSLSTTKLEVELPDELRDYCVKMEVASTQTKDIEVSVKVDVERRSLCHVGTIIADLGNLPAGSYTVTINVTDDSNGDMLVSTTQQLEVKDIAQLSGEELFEQVFAYRADQEKSQLFVQRIVERAQVLAHDSSERIYANIVLFFLTGKKDYELIIKDFSEEGGEREDGIFVASPFDVQTNCGVYRYDNRELIGSPFRHFAYYICWDNGVPVVKHDLTSDVIGYDSLQRVVLENHRLTVSCSEYCGGNADSHYDYYKYYDLSGDTVVLVKYDEVQTFTDNEMLSASFGVILSGIVLFFAGILVVMVIITRGILHERKKGTTNWRLKIVLLWGGILVGSCVFLIRLIYFIMAGRL